MLLHSMLSTPSLMKFDLLGNVIPTEVIRKEGIEKHLFEVRGSFQCRRNRAFEWVDYFFVKNRQKSKIVKNNKIIKLVPHFDLKIFRILTLNIN